MSSPRQAGMPGWVIGLIGCVVAAPVLVAVVGIVAAIAIPNFLRMSCRSKQSEAKANLTGLFVAEKAFFGEYNFYTTDLKALNWQPDGMPIYLYGFVEAGPYAEDLPPGATAPPDYDPERMDTSDPSIFGGTASYSSARMRDLDGNRLSPADLPGNAVVETDGSTFRAAAIGDLLHDGYGRLDVWTIDESKVLLHSDDDCR